jgi:hypothetical protein
MTAIVRKAGGQKEIQIPISEYMRSPISDYRSWIFLFHFLHLPADERIMHTEMDIMNKEKFTIGDEA